MNMEGSKLLSFFLAFSLLLVPPFKTKTGDEPWSPIPGGAGSLRLFVGPLGIVF